MRLEAERAEAAALAAEQEALRRVEEASQHRLAQLEQDKQQQKQDQEQAVLIGNRGGKQRQKLSFGMSFKKKK